MSTSATGGDWWESISVFSSDYVPSTFTPGSSVEANHDLLAGMRENDFDTTDSSYTLGLLTLALVFLVCGILACCLLPCCYLALGKSRQERLAERLSMGHKAHYVGNMVMLAAAVAAIFTASGAVWGLDKTDSGLTNIEDHTQDIATDLQSILNLPNNTMVVLGQLTTNYATLITEAAGCSEFLDLAASQTALLDTGLTSLTDDLLEEFDALNTESLSELADDVQGVSDAVHDTEAVRKGVVWPVIALAMFFTLVFVIIAISTYECIACGAASCGVVSCLVSPCTVFLAIVVWLSAAAAVTLSALSGDFCTDPDTNVDTLIAENSDDEFLSSLLTYYTGDCTSENVAVDAVLEAQGIAIEVIQASLPVLYSATDVCEDILPAVNTVNASLYDLWSLLDEAGQLSSCEGLNGPYQAAVYDELCDELPRGLLGFWVSCVILTVLLLVLAVQWNRMLRRELTEHDAQEAEEMARNRAAWLPKMLSRRSINSVSSSGSRRNMSRPATNVPNRWGSASTNAPPSGSHAGAVQRPVEISNPVRDR